MHVRIMPLHFQIIMSKPARGQSKLGWRLSTKVLLCEALTKWSVILPPDLDLRVLLKFVELIQGHQVTVTFWWLRAVLLSATLLTTFLAIVLFSSYVLFSQCRSCDNTLENCSSKSRLIPVHICAWFMKGRRGKFPETFIGKTEHRS